MMSYVIRRSLSALALGLAVVTAQSLEDSLSGFAALFPGEAGYSDAANAFNRRFSLSPAGITYPAATAEVSEIIKVGAQFGIAVVARSGGHNYIANGLGGKDGALVLDLNNITSLAYDESTGHATIGAGSRLGNIAAYLDGYGRGIPHGSCKYIGIGGHAAFGGFGYASRMWGLNLDAVLAAEIVLANGTVATVSKTSYPDLFWATRGSAPSFSIITSLTYQTYPVPESAITYGFDWTLEYPAGYYQAVSFRPADQKGTVRMKLSGAWYGEKSKMNETIAPFLAGLPTPSDQYTGGGTWIQSVAYNAGGGNLDVSQPDGIDHFYAKSLFTKQGHSITKQAADAFFQYLGNEGVGSSASWFVQFDLYGGSNSAVTVVPESDTSYANRDVFYNIQFYGTTGEAPFPSDGFALMDGMVDAIIENSPPDWPYTAYMNYIDDRLDNWQELYYGSHYRRLQDLKKRYDPSDVFRFPTSIELP